MLDRKNAILNYLILLQVFRYKIDEVRDIFEKYNDDIDIEPKNFIFKLLSNVVIKTEVKNEYILEAMKCYNENINNMLFYMDDNYPERFKSLDKYPILLFYKGNIELLKCISISIVGTRKASETSLINTDRISSFLIKNNIAIASGLAIGVDSRAHSYCMEHSYSSIIGVIATPIDIYYPKENKQLQDYVSNYGLLISEVPSFQNVTKVLFLRRNYIMSAISQASIVIEAGDTSGTLNQARATLKNKRALLVPKNTFENPNNSWPSKFRKEYERIYVFDSLNSLSSLLLEVLKDDNNL